MAVIEQRLVDTLAGVPDAEILLTFPALQARSGRHLLGAMGAPVSAFHCDEALRRHVGWSVEEERSGSSVARERLAVNGNRHSRRERRLWTLALIRPQMRWTPFRAHYKRLVAPPLAKRPNVALGHLASKIITVMYFCMLRGQPDDEQRLAKDMRLTVPNHVAAGK